MTVVDDEVGVRAQFAVWGYAVTGDMCETAALIAEGHPELVRGGGWDRTAADLAGDMIAHGDGPFRRVKDWAALPWVGEQLVRRQMDHGGRVHVADDWEWPGL